MVRVRAKGWVIHNTQETPYKHTRMCVCECVCVLLYAVANQQEEAHV